MRWPLAIRLLACCVAPLIGAAAEPARTVTVSGAPGDKPPAVSEWTDARLRSLSRRGDQLSTALFDLIEDIHVADIDLGKGKLGIAFGRRVYDNHDVIASHTVVDRMRFRYDRPWTVWEEALNSKFTARFVVGTRVGLEFVHIRQVAAGRFDTVLAPVLANADVEGDAVAVNASLRDPYDTLNRARWGRLWNILTVPWRVPFKPEWIERLAIGEIVSWEGSGTVEAGPSLGVDLGVPGALEFLQATANVRLFVEGRFRVTVLRESEHHVRVKLTRLAAVGTSISLGATTDDIVTGFTVLNGDPFSGRTTIVPFSISRSDRFGRSVDLVYRYDLRNPAAREAYRCAALGRASESEVQAGGTAWRDQPEAAPVRRIGDRSTAFTSRNIETSASCGILYRTRRSGAVEHADITLDVGAGPQHAFRSSVGNVHRWRLIVGLDERTSTTLVLWVDRDRLDAGANDAATLTLTQELSDSDTSGPELHAALALVEQTVGREGFFPRPPLWLPDSAPRDGRGDPAFDRHRSRDVTMRWPVQYGRISLFAQITWDQAAINRFLDTPTTDRWPLYERAFAVDAGSWSSSGRRAGWIFGNLWLHPLNLLLYPVNLHCDAASSLPTARASLSHWNRAQKQGDLIAQIRELAEAFVSRQHGPELARLLTLRLAGEPASYILSGSCIAFGSMREEGEGPVGIVPLAEQITAPLDFDSPRSRRQPVGMMTISNLSGHAIDHQQIGISFTLPAGEPPLGLYARLIERRPWNQSRAVGDVAVARANELVHPGANTLVLARTGGVLPTLMAHAQPGRTYVLQLAVSPDGRTWGPLAECTITLPSAPAEVDDPMRPRLED